MSEYASQLAQVESRTKPHITALELAARQLVVTDKNSAERCMEFLRHCKDRLQAIKEEFEPICKAAHEAHKQAVAFRDKVLASVAPADKIARDKLASWQRDEERKAREEAERLQRIEQARLDAEHAERQRIANEQAAHAEQERLAAIEAAKQANDQDMIIALAAVAPIAAEAIPVSPPAVVIPASAPQIKGFSRPRTWKARVVDLSLVPREWMIVNEKALGDFAKSTKGQVKIPGVVFYEEETTSVR